MMKNSCFNKQLIILILGLSSIIGYSQDIPHPIRNTGVYTFLDELANNQIITMNSAVKPYSRAFIARCLEEAMEKRELLSGRQEKELDFYLKDFGKEIKGTTAQRRNGAGNTPGPANAGPPPKEGLKVESSEDGGGGDPPSPRLRRTEEGERARGGENTKRLDLFYYKDSLFSLTVNPILGGEVFSNSAGEATYSRNGAEARAYVGKLGFYASLRDNHEKPFLGLPQYLTQREGGHIKGSTDWSEMQGGVTWSWKWGNAGLVKDNFEWGNNYNGANIFGGHNPSFVHLRMELYPVRWFRFNYIHGWLNSMVVDSTRSFWVTNSYGTDYREVYHRKFITANLFTFTPVKYLNISTGNSIIYDNTTVNPAFLIPVMFYKSVDHSVSSGINNMNSQMFFDISSRQIKHLHLYATLFVDELSVKRFFKDDEWNFFSWKAGFRLGDFPLQNLSLTTEFTYTYPLVYQHNVPTITFESNNYNLGHYMKDNSREWYVALDYKPLRAMDIRLFFIDAIRGIDHTELGSPRLGNPPLDTIEWQSTSAGLRVSYQVINDLYVWGSYIYSETDGDIRWSPEYYQGVKNTVNCGLTVGF